MTIRIRAILVIILTNLIIILFSVFAGINYVGESIDIALKSELAVKANLADHYLSGEIDKLKLKARWAAETLQEALARGDEINWPLVLTRLQELNQEFIGMTVFSSDGKLLAQAGEVPAPQDVINDKYIKNVFSSAGAAVDRTAISSTVPTENGVVFYLALPLHRGTFGTVSPSSGSVLPSRILVITLPGTYFRQLLSNFTIWDSGHIFLSDADGYVISNPRMNWLQERFNYIHAAQIDDDFVELAKTVTLMTQGETGTGYYTVYRIPRVGSFRPISGSEEGWSLGVVAPLTESPFRNIDRGLVMVALVSIMLNILAAIIASNFIKKPFEKIAMFKEEADAANKAKSAFLNAMSHEMRTPLNAVVGLSELILNTGEVHGEVEERLCKVHTSGMILLGIVNDILDISKIESGKFVLHPIEYDSPSLVNDIVSLNIGRIGEKPIKFILTVDENLPARIFGDDLRIKQVFNNLLSNAFKYTNAGTVEWKVSSERDGENVWLISEVKDTGMGIRKEDISKLFQDYGQVDGHANRKIESTGLGLSITKCLVEMMDGTITVESEYGKSTTFSVKLCQRFVSEASIGKETAKILMSDRFTDNKRIQSANLTRINLSYANVLVVDDMPINLDVAKGMLLPYKLNVDCAGSGLEAICMIREEKVRYDAVFMDHMMPGMDGVEAVRIIRNEIGTEYAQNLPIIALTANAIIGNEDIFLQNGFNAFISKPINMMRLDAVLRQWVRKKDHDAEYEADAEIESNNSAEHKGPFLQGLTIDGVDTASGLARFSGNEDVYIKILQSYAVNTRPLLDDIKKQLASEDIALYAVTVHGIKGASFGIGASKAGKDAEKLELLAKAGDKEQVLSENGAFIEYLEKLLDSIDGVLGSINSKAKKPPAPEPDPELLKALSSACAEYDMGKIDSIMAQLESFEYGNGGELVAWLRKQIDEMSLDEISGGNWPDFKTKPA